MSLEMGRGKDGAENLIGNNNNNEISPLLRLTLQAPQELVPAPGKQWEHTDRGTRKLSVAVKSRISSSSLQIHNLSLPRKGVSQGPFPPGLTSLPDFFWSGSNFGARGNADFPDERSEASLLFSVCVSNAKQEQLVAHNNMHCVSEQHNKQFARQPGDIRTILYNREERREGKNMQ